MEAAGETAGIVRGLIRNEHEGARHLRHLARQERARYGGLYPVLLETIARDSEKHAAMLRFLLRRIEERLQCACEQFTPGLPWRTWRWHSESGRGKADAGVSIHYPVP
jgi:hypothetical protein